MIGKKKLSEIQSDFREKAKASGASTTKLVEKQLAKLQANKHPDPVELETLQLLRDALSPDKRKKKKKKKRAAVR